MGLEVAAIVTAGIAGAAEIGKVGTESAAVNATEKALDLEAAQATVQYQQKQLTNYDVLTKLLAAQEARMTVSGAKFSSPSFNAIQRNTLNTAAKESRNLDIEYDLEKSNIEIEKRNVRSKLYASLFGDVADVSLAGAKIAQKWPTADDALPWIPEPAKTRKG